eukprot:2847876-Alexandrium_andersonii.AAC.1
MMLRSLVTCLSFLCVIGGVLTTGAAPNRAKVKKSSGGGQCQATDATHGFGQDTPAQDGPKLQTAGSCGILRLEAALRPIAPKAA